MEVVDVLLLINRSGLSAPAVHSCTGRYTDTGSAVCLHCFPESFAARPTGRWCGCRADHPDPAGIFNSKSGCIVYVAIMFALVLLFNTYCGQVMFSKISG